MLVRNWRHVSVLLWMGLLAAFALWCALALRVDLARLSFSPLLRSWDLILLAATLTSLGYLLRAARWTWYLRKLGHSLSFTFSACTYVAGFAFTLSPAKLGEVMRLSFYKGTAISLHDVAAAVLVERILDLLAMSALGLFAAAAFPQYEKLIWVVAIVIVGAAVATATVPGGTSTRTDQAWWHRLPSWANAKIFTATIRNARCLLGWRTAMAGFLVSVGAWGFEGLGLAVVSGLVPPPVQASVAVGIYALAMLMGALSFLPGGLGSTEPVLILLLISRGYSAPDSLLIALTARIVTLWFGVSLGWCAVVLLRRRSVKSSGSKQHSTQ